MWEQRESDEIFLKILTVRDPRFERTQTETDMLCATKWVTMYGIDVGPLHGLVCAGCTDMAMSDVETCGSCGDMWILSCQEGQQQIREFLLQETEQMSCPRLAGCIPPEGVQVFERARLCMPQRKCLSLVLYLSTRRCMWFLLLQQFESSFRTF